MSQIAFMGRTNGTRAPTDHLDGEQERKSFPQYIAPKKGNWE